MRTYILSLAVALATASYASAQPSFSGAFRGKLPNGSELLLSSVNGTTGVIYVLSYSSKTLDIATFSTASDGSFTVVTPRGVQASGRFTPSTTTGVYGGQTFSAARVPFYGNTQAIAGGFSGYANDQVARTVSSLNIIASNQGEVFLLNLRGSSFDAGVGVLDSSGNFSVPTVSGDRYSGRLAVVNGAVTGNITIAGYGTLPIGLVQTRTGVLQNVSTRGFVGTGDSVMIAGFIVADFSKAVIVRAMGPTLRRFGVTGVLADPSIEVFDSAGRSLGSNDDWSLAAAASRIPAASGLTDIDSKDAGMVLTLDPGAYTVVVRGVGGITGNAIVEVFEIR